MRQRSRRHTLLHNYELDARSSMRLEARSEAHELAHVRMRQQDVLSLRRPESMSRPIIALFSTHDARTPVSLRSDERLYVRLPEQDSEDTKQEHTDNEHAHTDSKADSQKAHTGSKVDSNDAHPAAARTARGKFKARPRATRTPKSWGVELHPLTNIYVWGYISVYVYINWYLCLFVSRVLGFSPSHPCRNHFLLISYTWVCT